MKFNCELVTVNHKLNDKIAKLKHYYFQNTLTIDLDDFLTLLHHQHCTSIHHCRNYLNSDKNNYNCIIIRSE